MLNETDLEAFDYWVPDVTEVTYVQPKSVMEMVEEFRVTMGQEKRPSLSEVLVVEEYIEWEECEPGGVEDLKELADLVYVCYGYANSRGWNLDEAIRRVHQNNLDRCVWPDGSIRRREDGKITKRPDAPKVVLYDLV